MTKRDTSGDLFPDAAAITAALQRQTDAALLRRLGPTVVPAAAKVAPTIVAPDNSAPSIVARAPPTLFAFDPIERQKARGISFGVDLIRAILGGRKTQTRRPVRPPPDEASGPPNPDDCPAARVGELLYVREPWLRGHDAAGHVRIDYAADESPHTGRRFRPAMYMARDAARLWLRVTSVRAERLQSISDADVAAEGLLPGRRLAEVWDGFYTTPGERYGDDPWVWVIGFGVEGGI